MPSLLLLCEYPTLSGGEMSMLATLPAVVRAGFQVAVAAPPGGRLAEELDRLGVERIARPSLRDGHSRHSRGNRVSERLDNDSIRSHLAVVIQHRSPDLLHANSLAMGRLLGPVAVELGVPSIAHLRDIIKLSRAAVADLNQNTRLVAVSQAAAEFHVGAGLDPDGVAVIHNGVDLAHFSPREPTGYLHRELTLAQDARLVGSIGQICLRKGLDDWMAAAARIAEEFDDVQFLIVGKRFSAKAESVQLEERIRAAANAPPLTGRVHCLGARGDIARLLPELTLLMHSARQEPLGRVLLEAAACGVAVVATDVGGTAEIFPLDARAAILVPPGDPAALAQAATGLVRDEPARLALAAAARRRAVAAFDIERQASQLVELYRDVLGT